MCLDEFNKMFEESNQIPSWAKGWKGYGEKNQDLKMKVTYVDWLNGIWHNPLYFHELASTSEKDIEERLKGYCVVFKNSFIYAWNNLLNSKHSILKQIEMHPKSDPPTKLKVVSICKKYLDPKTILVSVKVTTSQILIHINPKNHSDPKKIKEQIKNRLKIKFPNSKVVIKLTSEYVPN